MPVTLAKLPGEDDSNMGPDSKLSPSPTEELEGWRERQQLEKGNPVDEPLGPRNERGVNPVLGWPRSIRRT